MPILDEILDQSTTNTPPPHPRLRSWKERIDRTGQKPTLEVFRPPTLGMGTQVEMSVCFTENGTPQPPEIFPWNDDLNMSLIELSVRAIDHQNEVERFTLSLRSALRKATREFSDGYFNAILSEFVNESDLPRQHPEIADVMQHAAVLKPHVGRNYKPCRELIADAIVGRKYELEKTLNYKPEEARDILVKVLAKYLDERFSVSYRRRLGLLA